MIMLIEWEFGTSKLHYDPALVASGRDEKFALAFARIECHYFGMIIGHSYHSLIH